MFYLVGLVCDGGRRFTRMKAMPNLRHSGQPGWRDNARAVRATDRDDGDGEGYPLVVRVLQRATGTAGNARPHLLRISGARKSVVAVTGAAHHDLDEAAIIAQAGEPGRVTVATNMDGRGTDINCVS